jgi:outer membrane protein assembly factor BamA
VTKSALLFALRLAVLVVLFAPSARAEVGPTAAGSAVVDNEEHAQAMSAPKLDPMADLGALEGRPIARVEVVMMGERWTAPMTLQRVHPGDRLSAEVARIAMRELLESGRIARASAEAKREGDDVVLVVRAWPRRLIAIVQLSGGVLARAETLAAAGVREGGELTASALPKVAEQVRAFYREHGFTSASVTVDTSDTDDPMRIVLRINVEPGKPEMISQRVFVIEPAADRALGDLKTSYPVTAGARVDSSSLRDADRAMVETLRKSGYYRASVRHALRRVDARTYLYVYLDPGARLVAAFSGQRAFDHDELSQALALDTTAQPSFAELTERIRKFYVVRGFFDATVDSSLQVTPDGATHYLMFNIREGERVRVSRRVFACLPTEWPKDVTSLTADKLGEEIDSYLEEDLPGADLFWSGSPTAIEGALGPTQGSGRRAPSRRLTPATTFAPDTYDRSVKHLRELFHSEGYLNAIIGPVSVIRATCSPLSPPGECIPLPSSAKATSRCEIDPLGLPVAEPATPEALTCVPDPKAGVECARELTIRIPTIAGPRTILYDLAVEGNTWFSESAIAKLADLKFGRALSNVTVEASRLRVLDAYRDLGFAYAEVRTSIEPSPDRTRARVRFSISEREQVQVSGFVVRGATRTSEQLILGRIALRAGQPYAQALVRLSEERIATLGTFSSVSLSLEDPDVPLKHKRVLVTVVEQLPQYLDPRVGFSTGEGIRVAFEYGHRNVAGQAISLTLRVQLSYLFDFMVLDPQFRENLGPLPVSQRLERRNTVSLHFPEIGLGPLISLGLDGVDVRDNQRDFGLTRQALLPTLTYRPRREIRVDLGGSVELNDVQIFNADSVSEAVRKKPALARLLRVPDGRTFAVAQRLGASFDRRDNPFAATRGVVVTSGVEHVNAFPSDGTDPTTASMTSHFLRLTSKFTGYIRLSKSGMALALSLAGGAIVHLDSASQTYPDRLFFLGGVDSIRAFLADSVVPEDVAQRILNKALEVSDVGIRGGDLYVNPRLELRVPLNDTFALGVFLDTGNVWVDPASFDPLALRYAVGPGLRIATPVGPLALDYGFNLDRRPWEDVGAFHFSIGLF